MAFSLDEVGQLNIEMEKVKKAIKEGNKELDETSKKLKEAKKSAKDYQDTTVKGIKNSVKGMKNLNDLLGDSVSSIKSMDKEVRDLHLQGALNPDDAKKMNIELRRMRMQLMAVKKAQKGGADWDTQRKEVKKLNRMMGQTKEKMNLARNSAKSFVDHMSDAGPSFMKGWASFNKASKKGQTNIQSYQGMFNKAGSSLGKMPGLMKAFGGVAKGVAGTLGGVTKLIAGWPGAIFMALKAVWDLGMQADQFVKDANKAFATMRGPDIMTGDVRGQFKEFNDQIFNARENIRVGLDVTQVRELIDSISQAGVNITNLNKGLLSYRDAIYVASKASKTLGLALPTVGNMIGKLMTNFRMNMDSIDEAFVQVAFDAQKSGLATDRFWSTVENASASLAMYGVFVGAASKTMKRFTEDMVGGADDAAEATEDMFSIFKSGSMGAQAAFLDFAKKGGASAKKVFEEMGAEFGEQAVKVQSEIKLIEDKKKKTPENVEQLKKLRTELNSLQSKQQRALDMMNKNSVVQTTEMGMLAGASAKFFVSSIKGAVGARDLTEISGERLLTAIKGMEAAGVKEKTVRMLVEQAKVTKRGIENLLGSSKKYFSISGKNCL